MRRGRPRSQTAAQVTATKRQHTHLGIALTMVGGGWLFLNWLNNEVIARHPSASIARPLGSICLHFALARRKSCWIFSAVRPPAASNWTHSSKIQPATSKSQTPGTPQTMTMKVAWSVVGQESPWSCHHYHEELQPATKAYSIHTHER